jgi:hypothetical protein
LVWALMKPRTLTEKLYNILKVKKEKSLVKQVEFIPDNITVCTVYNTNN